MSLTLHTHTRSGGRPVPMWKYHSLFSVCALQQRQPNSSLLFQVPSTSSPLNCCFNLINLTFAMLAEKNSILHKLRNALSLVSGGPIAYFCRRCCSSLAINSLGDCPLPDGCLPLVPLFPSLPLSLSFHYLLQLGHTMYSMTQCSPLLLLLVLLSALGESAVRVSVSP